MFLYLVGHKALRQFGEIDPLVLMIFPAIVEGVIEVEPIDQKMIRLMKMGNSAGQN